jgi:hypothetical protein
MSAPMCINCVQLPLYEPSLLEKLLRPPESPTSSRHIRLRMLACFFIAKLVITILQQIQFHSQLYITDARKRRLIGPSEARPGCLGSHPPGKLDFYLSEQSESTCDGFCCAPKKGSTRYLLQTKARPMSSTGGRIPQKEGNEGRRPIVDLCIRRRLNNGFAPDEVSSERELSGV